MPKSTRPVVRPGTPRCRCPWADDPLLDADGNDVGLHLDGCPRQPWTQKSPEERQRILHTPITFTIVGGQGHGGTRFTELGGQVRGRRVRSPNYDNDDGHWNDSADDPNTITLEGDD
jgi:hypothetical protein